MNPAQKQWHALTIEAALSELTSSAEGLTTSDVEKRLAVVGKNTLVTEPPTPWWVMLLGQFKSPLVYILLAAAVCTAWLGEHIDTTVILLSVAVNTAIGFFQEYQASNLLEQLKSVVRVEALVHRDGSPRVLDAENLVPGDIIELKTGAKVPADCRVISVHNLKTGEAILTGESSPVKKTTAPVGEDVELGDRSSMVWMGTTIEDGSGSAVVVTTGASTEIGRIAELAMAAGETSTPLQERLARLANIISIIVGVSAVIIFIIGLLDRLSLVEVFTTAVAVAVSAIPEGLVAALSVVLAVSTARILKSHGLVRRPVAAETLGSTTVICTDKTGTLTEGVMKLEQFFAQGPEENALLSLIFANEAVIDRSSGKPVVTGESTDRAKLEFALTRGVDVAQLEKQYAPLAFLPFDATKKMLASFRREPGGQAHAYVSGATEALLRQSTMNGEGQPMTEERRHAIEQHADALAASGWRVIAVADRNLSEVPTDNDEALWQSVEQLTFRGLAAIRDPLRADVKATMVETRNAGVRVIMVTGDHKLTAMAIGRELGFRVGEQNVVEGATLDRWSDEELQARVGDIDLCVRVNPEHKLRMVNALKAKGEAVAMTGDGVNDAPALKAADIGVAVGSATDVTKEAADLVLLNDSFTTIVSAIREGRVAFDNIRKVTVLLLSGSFTAFLLVMASLVLGMPLPLSAVQILWANLVENGLPNFALAFEPAEPDVMKRPPVRRDTPILDGAGKTIVFGIAILRDFLLVGVFLWFYWYAGYSLEHVRTIVFAMLSTDSLFYIFSIKSFGQPLWRENFFDNGYLLLSIGVGAVFVVAAVYVPALNNFLGTVPLPWWDALAVVSLALFDVVLIECVKYIWNRRRSGLVDAPSVGLVQ